MNADHMRTGYRRVRQDVAALAEKRQDLDRVPVPHCPEWNALELVTHLVQVCARVHDRVTGQETEIPAQTEVTALLDRWEELSVPVDAFLGGASAADGAILVMDGFTHELDLADALGTRVPHQHPALPIAMQVLIKGLTASLDKHNLQAIAVHTEHGDWVAGSGAPRVRLNGPWREVYLALSGRRSASQLQALGWSADPRPWLPAFSWGPFTVPSRA